MRRAVLLSLVLCTAAVAEKISPERAKATFADTRVRTLLAAIQRDFKGSCEVPDADKADAKVTCNGGGDFSSCFYGFTLRCSGEQGLRGVLLEAEFSPPLGTPLNVNFTLQFRK